MVEEQISAGSGSTYFFTSLLDCPGFGPDHVELMRYIGLGGSPIPNAVSERADELGISLVRSYGSTEHPSVTGSQHSDPREKRIHTDGCPLEWVEVRTVDEEGHDVGVGRPGEILTRGPDRFAGYTDPALTAEAVDEEGWFRTGDIGVLDTEGYLTITDRVKDIIIRGGENVSAAEVEQLLAHMKGVAEVALVAAPDERLGEHGCAFFRMQPGCEAPDLEAVPRTWPRPAWPGRSGRRSCGSWTNCPGRRRARCRSSCCVSSFGPAGDAPAPAPADGSGTRGLGEVRSGRGTQGVQAGQGWSYACSHPQASDRAPGCRPPLLQLLQSELRSIAQLGTPVTVQKGEVLIARGMSGREFFLVLSGVATCRIGKRQVAQFTKGGYFGELALLHGGVRTADVVAETDMELLVFDAREFRTMLMTTPGISVKMLARLAERLADADAHYSDEPRRTAPGRDELRRGATKRGRPSTSVSHGVRLPASGTSVPRTARSSKLRAQRAKRAGRPYSSLRWRPLVPQAVVGAAQQPPVLLGRGAPFGPRHDVVSLAPTAGDVAEGVTAFAVA